MPNSSTTVELDVEDGVAIVTIYNPPINAASFEVRSGVVRALEMACEQGVTGAIVTCAGRTFIAGSDLKEFGKSLAKPELPDVISAIEDAPFPVVAALHGVALGGGLELALGCDYRIAAPGTKLGLPEVSLGIIPGAGGTQRVPRLTGRSKAIEMICDAKRIDAQEAFGIGLIDAVSIGDLLDAAKALLSDVDGKRKAIDRPVPKEPEELIEASVSKALRRGKGRPNVEEVIRLVRLCGIGEPAATLADERVVFQRLRVSPDAFALRYLFFAERRAGVVDGLDKSAARPVAKVGVVGGGTMGQGIAKAMLASGLSVTLAELDAEVRDAAIAGITKSLAQLVDKKLLSSDEAADQTNRLNGTVGAAGLSDCDLAIEAVFEDMVLKRTVLGELEAALSPEAIIATNTSYLDIDAMAEGLERPENVLGLHFFSPAERMPLLEIVRTQRTSDAALAIGLALAKTLGKQPVVAWVSEGFIGNRIYAAYRRCAELLVLDGAAPEMVDRAIRDFGFAMGPFEVSDASGLDIAWAMRKRLAATRDSQDRYVTIPDRLCEAGRFGRKSGQGWYDYATGKPQPDPEVAAIIEHAQAEAGITRCAFDPKTIQRLLMAAIVNEASWVIEEGVAQRPSDVDVALANGYGFPRWRGGPLYWAAHQELGRLEADLAGLEKTMGHGFRKGPVREVIDMIGKDAKAA